ncbi:MAG TPA: Ig-like domain-containing protein, partial [Gemmatimonadaceae bacterium]|nr:Ig-like domain-containing protein [Gemmatimonadaceae bacterium]
QGRIYITEYETENKKRVRALLQSASEARTRGDNSAALALYRDALGLDPANVEATEGSAAAAAIAHERDAGVKRQQRLLLGHVNSGDLTMRDYNRALSSLEADPASLDTHDLQYRRLVDAVVAGELTIRSFVRSTELLDSETGEHSQPSGTPVPAVLASETPPAATPSSTSGATQAAVVTSPQPSAQEPTSSAKNPSQAAKSHERPPSPMPRSSGSRWLKAIGGLAAVVIAFFIFRPHPGPIPTPAPGVVDSATQPSATSRAAQRLADSIAAAQAVAANRTAAVTPVPGVESPGLSRGQATASAARESKKASDRTQQTITDPSRPLPLKPPTLEPANGSTSVSIEAQITLRFTDLAPGDEIDRASLLSGNIGLTNSGGGGLSIVFGGDANTVRITPAGKLAEDTRYFIDVQKAVRTKLGRSLQSPAHYTFFTVTVDSLYFYRLINPNRSVVEGLTADSRFCRMEQEQSGGNQAWYFTKSQVPGYYIMHNAFGGAATGLEGAISPDPCRLNAVANPPTPGMLWYFSPVTESSSSPGRYFLQNMNFRIGRSLALGANGPVMQPTDPRDPQQWWMLQRQQRR